MPMFILIDVIIYWFNGEIERNIWDTTSSEQYLK